MDSDGLPEVVVTYLMANATYSAEVYDVNCKDACKMTRQSVDFAMLQGMTAVPFLVDITGSGDISFFTFAGTTRSVVQYSSDRQSLKSTPWEKMLINPAQSSNSVSLHFSAVIDVNGDCNSDLVLVSNSNGLNSAIEFYVKSNNNLYKQLPSLSVSKNITWLTFADVDANGAIDILLIALENAVYSPYLILNSNAPSDICAPSSNFPFSASNLRALALPAGYSLPADSNPKFADFNFDGFPDLLGLFSIKNFKKASILINHGDATFGLFDVPNIEEITSIVRPTQACIFDFTENGKIDLMIINQVSREDGTSAFVRTSIVNNLIEDTLFIKILPLLSTSSDDFESTSINSAIGVTVQWRITNLNGDKTISLLNQKSQWNYGVLQLPFVTVGLGRTNNYIEDLTVGYPGYGSLQTWTPIIPNSQLMVKREPEEEWALETLLKDNSRVYDVIYISIICLVLLGLVVFYLHWRENQEDKRDHYNFIQMIR